MAGQIPAPAILDHMWQDAHPIAATVAVMPAILPPFGGVGPKIPRTIDVGANFLDSLYLVRITPALTTP